MKDYELLVDNAGLPSTKCYTITRKKNKPRRLAEYNFSAFKLATYGALLFIALFMLYYVLLDTCKGQQISNAFGKSLTGSLGDSNGVFVRDASTSSLDCRRVMQHDVNYVKEMSKHRITYQDPSDLAMDCQSIKTRNYFPFKPNSAQEAVFPLAQARIVYKDYRFLEMELAAGYAPQNWYCFAIDKKADKKFHKRVKALASCLPNILTTQHEYSVDGDGNNMIPSYMECLKLLGASDKHWKYVSLLQNHDITIRTNHEAVKILHWMNGANDVEMRAAPAERVNTSLDWSFQAINMFRRASKYKEVVNGVIPRLVFAKGYVQASLSRLAVDYILHELDLTELIRREQKQGFGNDEIVIATLNAADALNLPGGFTHNCIDRGERVEHITRMSLWYDVTRCGSRQMRHAVCEFGMEDLPVWLAHLPHLFANKLLPEFDFGAIDCWYEEMFHRSYLETHQLSRLNATLYQSLPQVRFQAFKSNAKAKGLSLDTSVLSTFDCKTGSVLT